MDFADGKLGCAGQVAHADRVISPAFASEERRERQRVRVQVIYRPVETV